MKVLMVLNHAPDYREAFLRLLSQRVDLTVVAQPCAPDHLTPPPDRTGYTYVEIAPRRLFVFRMQPGLAALLKSEEWDVVCVSANLRQISRLFAFGSSRDLRAKWIWWGLIFGEHDHPLLHRLRKRALAAAAGVLVHSESVRNRLSGEYGIGSVSYNNTSVSESDFRQPALRDDDGRIHALFVGTYKPRKRIERLVEIADRVSYVDVRIIGPGMESLSVPEHLAARGRVSIYPRAVGTELNEHFDWADVVVSPGNTGLLVIEAARHAKPIAIDDGSYHGPEVWPARVTDQPFLSFGDADRVERFLKRIRSNHEQLHSWGAALRQEGLRKYTIEHMVAIHLAEFRRVAQGARRGEGRNLPR